MKRILELVTLLALRMVGLHLYNRLMIFWISIILIVL